MFVNIGLASIRFIIKNIDQSTSNEFLTKLHQRSYKYLIVVSENDYYSGNHGTLFIANNPKANDLFGFTQDNETRPLLGLTSFGSVKHGIRHDVTVEVLPSHYEYVVLHTFRHLRFHK